MDVAKAYTTVAQDYWSFYNSDLYSVKEDEAIAAFIRDALGPQTLHKTRSILDIGCGAGLPKVVWDALRDGREDAPLRYDGFDISPGMVAMARRAWSDEIDEGLAGFRVADAATFLPRLPEASYDLLVSLHGALSHLDRRTVPQVMAAAGRIARGPVVLSFLSRYADARSDEGHPSRIQYTCRQLENEPFPVNTWSLGELRALLSEAGLSVTAAFGVGVEGGKDEIHRAFVERQRALRDKAGSGRDVAAEWARLEADVDQLVARDVTLGLKEPDRGHDLIVVATRC